MGGVVGAILIAAGFVAFGWYQTQVKPGGKVVLQVGELKYTQRQVERRMKLTLQENTFFAQSPEFLPDTVILQLEREGKVLQAADRLNNTTVTDQEIDAEISRRGTLPADADARAFATEFRRQVDESGLKSDEYRQMIRAKLLEDKLAGYFYLTAPPAEPQVHARWILADQERARTAMERLQAGEDFAAVAREISQDTASAEKGGDLDWRPRGGFPDQQIEDFLFSAQPAQRSDVIDAGTGAYILELLERDDNRQLSDEQKQQVARRELNKWLDSLNDTLAVKQDFTDDDRIRALKNVF